MNASSSSPLTRLEQDSPVDLYITSIAHRLDACAAAVCEHGAWYECGRLADLVKVAKAEAHGGRLAVGGCCCWVVLALSLTLLALLTLSPASPASFSSACAVDGGCVDATSKRETRSS